MNESNKKFLSVDMFFNRIMNVINYKGISVEDLWKTLNDEVGYTITKNNMNMYFHRTPSANFLIALSKALGVSTDYLLGLEDDESFSSGFSYKYKEPRYKKYIGNYKFYFYPTVSSVADNLNESTLEICDDGNRYSVRLTVQTDEGGTKVYVGNLLLSDTYNVGYISLRGDDIGEMVFMSFCDPVINNKNMVVQNVLGAMLSVSSGDFKRVPVSSRFFFSREPISKEKQLIVKSNLLMNTKYINISKKNIMLSLETIDVSEQIRANIFNRLASAFCEKEYYSIEESYIQNTLKYDLSLTTEQAEQIIATLRTNSLSNANMKINRSLDSRIFLYINPNMATCEDPQE